MSQAEETRKLEENSLEKISREAKADNAKKRGYSKKCTVFEWVQDHEDPEFYRRTRVIKSEVEVTWTQYHSSQRRYWSHIDEWDLCPFLPGNPSEESDSEYDDWDYAGEFPQPAANYSGDSNSNEDLLVSPRMLKTALDQAAQEIHGHDKLNLSPQIPTLGEYLRRRHGFNIKDTTWTPELHATNDNLNRDQDWTAAKRLSY
ncbi:hypothetical protein H0H93_001519, partial [Arthromyces matolae]